MFSVCMCSRFQANPKKSHLSTVKRILRYHKHTPSVGLWYPKGATFELIGNSDSDYAGSKIDRKSTSGGCHLLRRSQVSWTSKKQNIVALSTAEAEYIATVLGVFFSAEGPQNKNTFDKVILKSSLLLSKVFKMKTSLRSNDAKCQSYHQLRFRSSKG
jgi:hypothetical protein